MPNVERPGEADYRRLLAFRTGLRRFLRTSDAQARAAGVTPSQHQLLLAIRGYPDERGPTIGDAASYLLISHHATVQLVDRAQRAGLVERASDPDNWRVVRLRMTATGADRLRRLSSLHLRELTLLEPAMQALWTELGEDGIPASAG
jgi:DNA-binding MarR family transcriptional regulator